MASEVGESPVLTVISIADTFDAKKNREVKKIIVTFLNIHPPIDDTDCVYNTKGMEQHFAETELLENWNTWCVPRSGTNYPSFPSIRGLNNIGAYTIT